VASTASPPSIWLGKVMCRTEDYVKIKFFVDLKTISNIRQCQSEVNVVDLKFMSNLSLS
jgi:hypothetical protein